MPRASSAQRAFSDHGEYGSPSSSGMSRSLRARQLDPERRALAGAIDHADPATVRVGDPLHGREADAEPGLAAGGRAPERLEHGGLGAGPQAGPVVLDLDA